VPAHELEEWRRVFLESGTHGLKKRIDPEDRELRRVQAKLGEVMMWLELAEDLLEKKGYAAVAEARAMSQRRSPFTHRRYPLTMVCATYRVARATVYAQAGSPDAAPSPRAKRGPKTPVTDVVTCLAFFGPAEA